MKRRAFLGASGSLTTAVLAGCVSEGTPGGGGQDDPTDDPDESGTDTPTEAPEEPGLTVMNQSIETRSSECASSGQTSTATASFDDGRLGLTFSGTLIAPDPCHEATIESVTYDESADSLSVVLGTEASDGVCTQCVAAVEFEGRVELDNVPPSEATIEYEGEVIGSAGGENPTDTPVEHVSLVDTSFEITDVSQGEEVDTANAEFDTDANEVVITGTISGSDSCTTAELGMVEYGPDTDELLVDVRTTQREDAEGPCAQAIVEIDYEAVVSFEGGLPQSLSVSHDGNGVMSAAHGSSSASAPDDS